MVILQLLFGDGGEIADIDVCRHIEPVSSGGEIEPIAIITLRGIGHGRDSLLQIDGSPLPAIFRISEEIKGVDFALIAVKGHDTAGAGGGSRFGVGGHFRHVDHQPLVGRCAVPLAVGEEFVAAAVEQRGGESRQGEYIPVFFGKPFHNLIIPI